MQLVLLHGAGLGPWAWQPVIERLATPATAPDVPSRSTDASPDHCARELASEIERGGEDEIVLVLHSLAGVLAAPLAELLGPRLRHCVYVSAVVPPPGRAFVDALGFPNSLVLRVLFKLHRNGLKPSPAMIRQELCNDLDPDQAEQVISRYQAEFPGLYLRPSTARNCRQAAPTSA